MKNQYFRCKLCNSRVNLKNINRHRRKVHSFHSNEEILGENFIEKTEKKSSTKPLPVKRYVDYYEYISSDAWKKVSLRKKREVGNRCQVCNRSYKEVTLHVHHRTYKNLGNERSSDLTVLCKDCHLLFESQSPHRISKKKFTFPEK